MPREKLAEGAAVVVIGFRTDKPAGYGRLIEQDGDLVAIREEKDCTDAERKITFCNSGLMAISGKQRWRCSTRSATTTPRANTISPTSSRSPARPG